MGASTDARTARSTRSLIYSSARTSAANVEVFAFAKTFFTFPSGPMMYATRFAFPLCVVSAAPYCTPMARVGSERSG
jgi:hypothetical protein